MTAKRAQKMKEIQEENKRLALEKRRREQNWREEQESLNQKEIADPNFTTAWLHNLERKGWWYKID